MQCRPTRRERSTGARTRRAARRASRRPCSSWANACSVIRNSRDLAREAALRVTFYRARSPTAGRRPAALVSGMRVPRNTPTLINVGLQPAQFADERAVQLEDQVVEVLRSRAEMASSIDTAAARVGADGDYRARFALAFGGRGNDGASVTPLRIRQALAAYERSLIGMSSRFDRAVRGDTSAITADERRGFNLFMGKAGAARVTSRRCSAASRRPCMSRRTSRSSVRRRHPTSCRSTRTPGAGRSTIVPITFAPSRSRRSATWPSPLHICTTEPFSPFGRSWTSTRGAVPTAACRTRPSPQIHYIYSLRARRRHRVPTDADRFGRSARPC